MTGKPVRRPGRWEIAVNRVRAAWSRFLNRRRGRGGAHARKTPPPFPGKPAAAQGTPRGHRRTR
jgi:hypothetical protein